VAFVQVATHIAVPFMILGFLVTAFTMHGTSRSRDNHLPICLWVVSGSLGLKFHILVVEALKMVATLIVTVHSRCLCSYVAR
jgi:hypothetical protein